MARLIWLITEIGPLIWFAPAFLCLAYAAWRGGYTAAALALGCLLTGSALLVMPGLAGAALFQSFWAQLALLVVSSGAFRLILPLILSADAPSNP